MQKEKFSHLCVAALVPLCVIFSRFAGAQETREYRCTFSQTEVERIQTIKDVPKSRLTEEEKAIKRCYTIAKAVDLWDVSKVVGTPEIIPRNLPSNTKVGAPGSSISTYLYLFKEVWAFLEKNKPVVDADTGNFPYTAVLPTEASKNWEEVQFPAEPPRVSQPYVVSRRNLYGLEVIRLEYSIRFTPKGVYRGKGQYLNNVMVSVDNVRVLPGFSLKAESKVLNLLNFGGTREDPVAGLQLFVRWELSSILSGDQGSRSFLISGKGDYWEVGPGTGVAPTLFAYPGPTFPGGADVDKR